MRKTINLAMKSRKTYIATFAPEDDPCLRITVLRIQHLRSMEKLDKKIKQRHRQIFQKDQKTRTAFSSRPANVKAVKLQKKHLSSEKTQSEKEKFDENPSLPIGNH